MIDRGRVDVAVVDYGLTPAQRELLGSRGVLRRQGRRDGNVTVLRLRDVAAFLACHRYDQVMVVDGGGVIFQDEFAEVFAMSPHSIRVTCETNYGVEFWRLYLRGSFRRSLVPVIRDELRCRMAINTGMFIGPSTALQRCFSEAFRIIVNRWRWGADAVALNYVLYRDGFAPMNETYNYVPVTARRSFRIRQGWFYFRSGSLIKIVHNTGGRPRYRIIGRFGQGATASAGSGAFSCTHSEGSAGSPARCRPSRPIAAVEENIRTTAGRLGKGWAAGFTLRGPEPASAALPPQAEPRASCRSPRG